MREIAAGPSIRPTGRHRNDNPELQETRAVRIGLYALLYPLLFAVCVVSSTIVPAFAQTGKYVPLKETIRAFEEILAGKHDDKPEQAFYMKGGIEEVK